MPRPHWEYHVETVPVGQLDIDRLNELGRDRWELIEITPGATDRWLFKREV